MFGILYGIFFCTFLLLSTPQAMGKSMKITQGVIPAAGLGTRFLPYTKAIPKEMLPLLDKPSMQLIIEEGLLSHITDFKIIANDNKSEIKHYLSHDEHLEKTLEKVNKLSLLDGVNKIINAAHFDFIPQLQQLGLGHAVLQAKEAIGDEYFGVFLPDEIMIGEQAAMAQLIAIAEKYNASVVGVLEVPQEKVSSYGIIAIKQQLEDSVFEIDHLVEKPALEKAPSRFALAGRYVLSPRIFHSLENIPAGAGNEIQLTDGIEHMMRNGERVIAYVMKTERYDVGNPLGWIQANITLACAHPIFGEQIKEYCRKIIY